MMTFIGTAALVLLGVTSLTRSSEATQAIPDDFVITLERTACFGACPVYSVSIDAKGNVTYDGTKFVRIVGRQTDRVAVPRVAALVQAVDRIRFFELEDKYHQMITDLPTTFVTVTRDGRSKRVEDYFGAPESLKELEREIDQTAGTARWINLNSPQLRSVSPSTPSPAMGKDVSVSITD
jgi:hypothetical protein